MLLLRYEHRIMNHFVAYNSNIHFILKNKSKSQFKRKFMDAIPYLKVGSFQEEEEKHFSSSIISLNVEPGDDGKDLVCRAENPRFPGGHAEDRRQIHVACKYVVARLAAHYLLSTLKKEN